MGYHPKEDRRLIGSVGIRSQALKTLKYARARNWLDESHWGKGLHDEAVQSVLDYGFNTLQLKLALPANLCYTGVTRRFCNTVSVCT